ncbi:acetate--CoA ligase family protein [Roseomonas populi]|uniref:Acetate--CoA ligase family protein n=1 Tax=Roseomonas populi TaxID=3121582 RepID=A0ABT1XCK4_9PROT|nr:acetate--CoA ligase family protein [Roseomonas pecuniae]MCR0985143.1 acetate--CoA ligase family protein [Roseomonas pecuniae]
MNAIARLLTPRSVAVVGASADATKMTGRPVGYLRKHGFTGEIYPVNPRVAEIGGLTCYPDVASLPQAPDAAIVLLGPERAEQAVRDLAARGTAAAIVLASGYGEADEEGARRQRALKDAAGSMRLLGPNTIGLVNLTDRITLSATGALEMGNLRAGSISVVSQSGGILGSLLSRATDRGIGFAKLASTGNEADLDSTDLMEHLLDDDATRVIAVYMEGLRRPEAFRRVALRAAAIGKPIVMFKVGRSESGARSASSHTGAMAGSDRVYDALFRQCGVIRAETFADLLDIPAALAAGRRAAGKRVAILTSTGGAGTLVADSLGLSGFDVPVPDEATAGRIGALTGEPASAARNPVDVTLAGLRPDLFRGAIDALQESPGYDATIVIVGSSALAQPSLVADAVVECQARSDKPILCYVSPHAPEVTRLLNNQGIPAFTAPESCAAVLAALQPRPAPDTAPPAPADADPAFAALPPGPLNEAESKALFARFGVPVAPEAVAQDPAGTAAAAQGLGDRVVLKVLSREILHKSDLGGVAVGLTAEALPEAAAAMLERLRAAGAPAPEGFLVQAMVRGGVEMILGFHRDPQLGPVLLLGMGGVAAELLQDTALRLLPISRADAEGMVAELRTGALLKGFRGAPPADLPALVDAILAFAAMAGAAGERLLEAEINPLFVLPAGQGVCAADGLAVLG